MAKAKKAVNTDGVIRPKKINQDANKIANSIPEPWEMPGYTDKVIMAAGAFVSGSSIELSADGPIKPPYAVYFQKVSQLALGLY